MTSGLRALLAAARTYDRRLWVLYAGFVASSMGFAMVAPFVSLYFFQELGVPMRVVGGFFLVSAVFRSVFQGYAGDLSDRLGRTRLMVWGQGWRAAAFAAAAGAVLAGWGFVPVAAILLVSYAAGAFFQPVASAAVSDLVEPERRVTAYAMMRVAHNLGWGVGPLLGGVVSEAGYHWLFAVGAVSSGFSAWLLRRYFGESLGAGGVGARADAGNGAVASGPDGLRGILSVRHDTRFLVFCGLTLLVFLTMAQWWTSLPVYASEMLSVSNRKLGLLFGLNGFVVVVFQLPVTRRLAGWPLTRSMILGSAIYTVSFFSLAWAGSYVFLVCALLAVTLGELIVTPPTTTMVSLIAPPGRMGRYMGVFTLITSFGWSVGPFIGGWFLDWWMHKPLVLWGAVASFGLVATVGLIAVRNRYPTGVDGGGTEPTDSRP